MIACLDFSGNYRFLGIVVGDKRYLVNLHKYLLRKYGLLHIREIPSRNIKYHIVYNILCSKNLIFYCLYIDRQGIFRKLAQDFPRKSRKIFFKSLSKAFSTILYNEIFKQHNVREIYVCKDVEEILNVVNAIKHYLSGLKEIAGSIAWINSRKERSLRDIDKNIKILMRKINEVKIDERLYILTKKIIKSEVRKTHQP